MKTSNYTTEQSKALERIGFKPMSKQEEDFMRLTEYVADRIKLILGSSSASDEDKILQLNTIKDDIIPPNRQDLKDWYEELLFLTCAEVGFSTKRVVDQVSDRADTLLDRINKIKHGKR